jgi:hypothetical protein
MSFEIKKRLVRWMLAGWPEDFTVLKWQGCLIHSISFLGCLVANLFDYDYF